MKTHETKSFVLLAFGVVLNLFIDLSAIASSGSYQVSGFVTDTNGIPITGLLMTGDDRVGDLYFNRTDQDGYYSLDFDTDATYDIYPWPAEVSERGYNQPLTIPVTLAGTAFEINWVLVTAGGPLLITNTQTLLPKATVGLSHSFLFGATGGQPPYTWSVPPGSNGPPGGLVLNGNGMLSGVPTNNISASFAIKVTDSGSHVVTRNFGISINPRPSLSAPVWIANHFTMRINGSSNQTYTIQMATNLHSGQWVSLFVTNHVKSNSFLISDATATNQQRYYRLLIAQ